MGLLCVFTFLYLGFLTEKFWIYHWYNHVNMYAVFFTSGRWLRCFYKQTVFVEISIEVEGCMILRQLD